MGADLKKNIEYGKADGESLLLDASTPDGDGLHPIAIVVHGGGWASGDKAVDPAPELEALTDAKFTWFSINYRLAPKHRWPACFEDMNTAIRWAKQHAGEYKGDPTKVALIGYSAGGQLVTLAATTATPETTVQAVVGLAPPTDLELDLPTRGGLSKSLQDLYDRPHELTDESRQKLHDMSAINHLHAGLCPFLIIHGSVDKSVPYPGSINLRDKLKGLGVKCDLITIEGAGHAIADWKKKVPDWPTQLTTWLHGVLDGTTTQPVAH